MSLALWCVLAAGVLPILTVGVAKYGVKNFDNADPRGWEASLDGFRARAMAAQNNGFEAFPLFAAAVLVAETQHGARGLTDVLAAAFVALRLAYVACYIGDLPTLRSTVWSAGFLVTIAIFTLPVWA